MVSRLTTEEAGWGSLRSIRDDLSSLLELELGVGWELELELELGLELEVNSIAYKHIRVNAEQHQ